MSKQRSIILTQAFVDGLGLSSGWLSIQTKVFCDIEHPIQIKT
jgi:hypothetical protein